MSVKLTLSYETEQELENAIKLLEKQTISCKVPKKQSGKYKKAYFVLKNSTCKTGDKEI